MWLLNVVREILKISQFRVYPIKIPHTDTENFEIYKKESLKDKTNFNKYVFKVHTILKSDLPRSKILTTIRDPRDVCVSFKEFMKSDFKSALDATKNIIRYVKIYKTFNKNYLKFFKYEDIEKNSIEIILKISKFIECKINFQEAENISIKFNKNNVKKIIKINDEILNSKIKNKEKINKSDIVHISKDNYRSFDTDTGFQTNHISARNSGDWKKVFSAEEIEIINSEFKDFLVENNYY